MTKASFNLKCWLLYVLIILDVSVFVLYPSFNLALTGDDYLGFWRYNETLAGRQDGPRTPLSYFFIDYGPQDITTAIIHSFVGWNAKYYY